MTPCYLVGIYLRLRKGLLIQFSAVNSDCLVPENDAASTSETSVAKFILHGLWDTSMLLNMEAGNSSEFPVTIYISTWLHIPIDFNPHQSLCEKLTLH
jgi:hypothetical protein